MLLEQRLAAIREMASTRQSPEVRAIMHRATDDLRASGIMDPGGARGHGDRSAGMNAGGPGF